MAYQDIVVDVVDGVSTITINRPDNANKLRFQTARELLDALRICPRDLRRRRRRAHRRGQQVLLHRG